MRGAIDSFEKVFGRGSGVVMSKEVSDHFSSRRFLILAALIAVTGIASIYVAAVTIGNAVAMSDEGFDFVFLRMFLTSSSSLPPFTAFVGFLGPLVGLAMGFDAINGERMRGTLSRVLAQPIHRDAVINGKFVAGAFVIGVMVVSLVAGVSGMGALLLGVGPTSEELARLLVYTAITIAYVSLWLAVSILFSVIFRQASTSALAGMALWLFASVFLGLLAGLAADSLAPLGENPSAIEILRYERIRQGISRVSPATLYSEAVASILSPNVRAIGPILAEQLEGAIPGPLPLRESVLNVWPHVTGLVAGMLLCFAAAYLTFMRQEIRAG